MLDSGDWDSIAVVKCAVEDYHYSAFDHSVVEVGEGLHALCNAISQGCQTFDCTCIPLIML